MVREVEKAAASSGAPVLAARAPLALTNGPAARPRFSCWKAEPSAFRQPAPLSSTSGRDRVAAKEVVERCKFATRTSPVQASPFVVAGELTE